MATHTSLQHVYGRWQAYWRALYTDCLPPDQDDPFISQGPEPRGTRARYGRARLLAMRRLDRLVTNGPPRTRQAFVAALAAAVRLGMKLGADEWRFGTGDRLAIGQKSVDGTNKGIAAKATALQPFVDQVRAYRLGHPEAKVRSIAVQFLPTNERQDRKAIDNMRQKIGRALKK
jgi:hypothetical protein